MVQEAPSPVNPIQPNFNPTAWWQWVMVYPALFSSLLSNIPQIVEKTSDLVTVNGAISLFASADEREQAKYWLANVDCKEPARSLHTTQSDHVSINVTLCPKTGDVLVSLQDTNPKNAKTVKPVRRWVKVSNPSENALSSFLMPGAIAATVHNLSRQSGDGGAIAQDTTQVTVLCQRLLGDNQILRRLQYADGHCVNEVVNTLTGEVVSQTESSQCSAGC